MGLRSAYIKKFIKKRTNYVVQSGMFEGLQYIKTSTGSALFPKLVGTYEKELRPELEKMLAQNPTSIINVGAGEGYYTAGLARKLPNAEFLSFETSSQGQKNIRELCSLNNLSNKLEINGTCTAELLEKSIAGKRNALVIMDIEGAEVALLDLKKVPSLVNQMIMLEVHDCEELISNRFKDTHNLVVIKQQKRTIEDIPLPNLPLQNFPRTIKDRALIKLVDEGRGQGMTWFAMWPRNISAE